MSKFCWLFVVFFHFICSCGNESSFSDMEKKNIVSINLGNDSIQLDPRLARNLPSFNVLKMLYEGLTRLDENMNPASAIAEKIDVSEDGMVYTFYLRKTFWSDGSPLTAQDFEYTWKSLLRPNFPAEYANVFYVIKNAKESFEGKVGEEEIGVKAVDDYTLSVRLEYPNPHFLHLVSLPVFSPISKKQDLKNPNWSSDSRANLISNGPFILSSWKDCDEIKLVKNPLYFDKEQVKLEGIRLFMLDESTELSMFEVGKIDWAGSPISTIPADAIKSFKEEGKLFFASSLGTHFFRFNIERPPFHNAKMRKALSYAVHRSAIAEHVLLGGQIPAMGFLPPGIGVKEDGYFKDYDAALAKKMFNESLEEMQISKEDLPRMTLIYTMNDRSHKLAQAVQQQWKETLGIDVFLENMDGKAFLQKRKSGDYQIANGSWIADYSDPMNFLEIFQYKSNGTNNTFWEDGNYCETLKMAQREGNMQRRQIFLREAERILMEEMPILPTFYYTFAYLKHKDLDGVFLSDLGVLDFKTAYFK